MVFDKVIEDYITERRELPLVVYIKAEAVVFFSQKQLPRKMKSRLVIIVCAGYTFWQLFLQ